MSQSQRIVMVVDDSQTICNIMGLILTRGGYYAVEVGSAEEALSLLMDLTPDLIFLDITLPGVSGIDFCKALKETPAFKDIPVVLMSGSDDVFNKVMGRLVGALDYIMKPFEPETILKCAQMYCAPKESATEAAPRPVPSPLHAESVAAPHSSASRHLLSYETALPQRQRLLLADWLGWRKRREA